MNFVDDIVGRFYVAFPENATVADVAHIRERVARRDALVLGLFTAGCLLAFLPYGFPAHMYVAIVTCALVGLTLAAGRLPFEVHTRTTAMAATAVGLCLTVSVWGATGSGIVYYVPCAVVVVFNVRTRAIRNVLLAALSVGFAATWLRYAPGLGIHVTDPELIREIAWTDSIIATIVTGLTLRSHAGLERLALFSAAAARERLSRSVDAERATTAELIERRAERSRATEAEAGSLAATRRASHRLRASAEQLQQFAYAASHDLKEPIRTIRSFGALAERRLASAGGFEALGEEDAAAVREYFGHVGRSAEAMHELLERLLAYTRLGSGETSAKSGSVAMQAAVEAAYRTAAQREPLVASHLTLRWRGGNAEAETDERLLGGALEEFVVNAARFATEGGARAAVLEARIRYGDSGAVLVLADDGPGVAPEFRETVFGVFKRLHARGEYTGSGLGLALARRALGCCGATATLHTSEAGGLEVRVGLPAGAES